MSSKFIDRLDEIREGAPARMGFGPARSSKTPGLALLLVVSQDHQTAAAQAAALSPDAVLLAGIAGPPEAAALRETLAGVLWGVQTAGPLPSAAAQAYRDGGAALLAFGLPGAALGAVADKDTARLLLTDPTMPPEDLRDLNALPVDAALVPLAAGDGGADGELTLADLARLARVGARVGKHLLAQTARPPQPAELEALRDAGVVGLALDVTAGAEAIAALQQSLLNMPRPGAHRRRRSSALLPGAIYGGPQPDPDDDPDEE